MHWDIVICHLKNHVKIVAGILQRIMYIYLWYVMDMVEVATVGSCIGWLVDATFSFMKASVFVGSDKE